MSAPKPSRPAAAVVSCVRPQPPIQPDIDDCCNSGCNPCIFDLYQEALERYQLALKIWEAAQQCSAQQ